MTKWQAFCGFVIAEKIQPETMTHDDDETSNIYEGKSLAKR